MIQSKTSQGLSYVIDRSAGNSACASLSVKCGTRAENDLPEGTAHFLEHCLFKGTTKRSAFSINSILDRLGGELNAYTTKEEIVLHATVLKEDIVKAISLLLEIGTQANFPEDEIEIEKGVVIDEIISYKDSPCEDIFDCFEKKFFSSHPLGRLTLGTEDSVKSTSRDNLISYYERYFKASNMVLSIVCDIDEKKLDKSVRELSLKYFKNDSQFKVDTHRERHILTHPEVFTIKEDKDNHEANLLIGALAPSLYDNDRASTILLANILGGPASNSLLNANLREKHGWVYASECSYAQYSDAGLLTISIGCDKGNLSKCIKAISNIINRLKTRPLSEKYLKASKKQLFGQLAISSDSKESKCLSMGKSVLAFGHVISEEETKQLINSVTSNDIQALCRKLWDEGNYSQLLYL